MILLEILDKLSVKGGSLEGIITGTFMKLSEGERLFSGKRMLRRKLRRRSDPS